MPGAVACVHPLVTARAVDHAFDYALPEALRETVQRGSLVEVELGPRVVRGWSPPSRPATMRG